MPVIRVESLADKGVEVYSSLTDHELRGREKEGIIIVESPKVIKVALEEGFRPLSILCEEKHITGDAADIINSLQGITVYTGEREILANLTGYKLTRGVLCAMKRPSSVSPASVCEEKERIAVIESVCDTTNIGSIFRSAAALGIDGVLLTPDSCDPFNRRSIRVSMGTVFKIPWAKCDNPIDLLKEKGFTTLALALDMDALPIDSPKLKSIPKIAMVLGTEGTGLTRNIIEKCDYKVIIPMFRDVDSLNVGVAASIAFWELRPTS